MDTAQVLNPDSESGATGDPMTVWIIGGGTFGRKALSGLKRRMSARYLLVDFDPETCEDVRTLADEVVCRDGIVYLAERLSRAGGPRWIVPAVPVHLSYEWVRRRVAEVKRVRPLPVPAEVADRLPNPMRGKNGELYLSNADFICPPDCPEPHRICSHTGRERPCTLFERLREFRHGEYRSLVIRSRQLAPGVGGYSPRDLFNALDAVLSADQPVLMSTACKCHGVMNAFSVESAA